MAKVVDDSVIRLSGSKYAQYLDGQTWELIRGEDYNNDITAKNSIYSVAYNRGLKVSVRRNKTGTGFYVKATPQEQPQE